MVQFPPSWLFICWKISNLMKSWLVHSNSHKGGYDATGYNLVITHTEPQKTYRLLGLRGGGGDTTALGRSRERSTCRFWSHQSGCVFSDEKNSHNKKDEKSHIWTNHVSHSIGTILKLQHLAHWLSQVPTVSLELDGHTHLRSAACQAIWW